MMSRIVRHLALACALSAAVVALAAPGNASAAAQCSGEEITGQGAAAATVAIGTVWGPDFNTSSNPTACSGSLKPKVNYDQTSSGIGLESWGVKGGSASFGGTNAFVATEEPPSQKDKEEIEGHEKSPGSAPNSLQTIPVAQEAIAVIVHLPAGCTATSKGASGRLVLNNDTLEEIWAGKINDWSEITSDGDALSGSGCNPATPITRIVRKDPAGTTHVLKKYLDLINSSALTVEGGGSETWNELSEGAGNTVWPTAASVSKPSKEGDSAEISDVGSTASSIGYGGLADVRKNSTFVPSTGGANTATFWVPIQNNGTANKSTEKYADPATNGDLAAKAEANCSGTKYTNGTGSKFPPKYTYDSWSPVTTATKEKNYPLCAIVYTLALSKYSAYPSTSEPEATTVNNFLNFVLNTASEGGQQLILNNDYEPLTSALDKESLKGVALVKY